ncbi:unknown [Eggerthella sp. CAG:209]|nr:unknown [Eggerthella sp. CAG:209]
MQRRIGKLAIGAQRKGISVVFICHREGDWRRAAQVVTGVRDFGKDIAALLQASKLEHASIGGLRVFNLGCSGIEGVLRAGPEVRSNNLAIRGAVFTL